MTGDDLERRLAAAFDAQARASVNDSALPPAPRFAQHGRQRRGRLLAQGAAAAAVLVVVASVLALRDSHRQPVASTAARAVHIRIAADEHRAVGVGMPVIAYFSRWFRTAAGLSSATSVTVNGKPVQAAWYFERSTVAGFPVEGHLRMRDYWPAHATIRVRLATRGVAAGSNLRFADAPSVAFRTSAKTVAIVDRAKHQMIVTSDGKWLGNYPVSLGAPQTRTSRGIKVIMAKQPTGCLSGPGYHECGVRYTQQLTYSGEYLLSAPWNVANIKRGLDTSNGCTNLLPDDARRLYKMLNVGDVVDFPDADGPTMRPASGIGDWNVPWRVWRTGGAIPTR